MGEGSERVFNWGGGERRKPHKVGFFQNREFHLDWKRHLRGREQQEEKIHRTLEKNRKKCARIFGRSRAPPMFVKSGKNLRERSEKNSPLKKGKLEG